MSEKIVIAGPSSQGLAVRIANHLNVPVFATENKIFPDKEHYLRIDVENDSDIEGKDCIVPGPFE